MRVPSSDLGVVVERDSDPIAGEVRHPDGSTTRFQGYVQLIAVVERAHRGAGEGAPESDRVEERHAG